MSGGKLEAKDSGTLPPADLHAVQRIANSHVVPDEKAAEEWCMLKQIDPI